MIQERPKVDFPIHAFYNARAQSASALRALISEMRSHSQSFFVSLRFDAFLKFKIHFSKYLKNKIKVTDVLAIGVRLLW